MIKRLLATRSDGGVFLSEFIARQRLSTCVFIHCRRELQKYYEKVITLKTFVTTNMTTTEGKCAISLIAFWLLRISHVASVRGKQSSTKELYRIRRQLSSDMTGFTRRCADFKVSRQPSCYYKRKFDSIVTNTIRYVQRFAGKCT